MQLYKDFYLCEAREAADNPVEQELQAVVVSLALGLCEALAHLSETSEGEEGARARETTAEPHRRPWNIPDLDSVFPASTLGTCPSTGSFQVLISTSLTVSAPCWPLSCLPPSTAHGLWVRPLTCAPPVLYPGTGCLIGETPELQHAGPQHH